MILNPIPWPNGAKCAACITFDMDADSLVHIAHAADGHSRVAAISMLQYGPKVAVPRILESYRQFGIKQTFFVPAWCIEQYPQAIEAMLEGGHELAHHGFLHEHPRELPDEEEAYWLDRGIEVIERVSGGAKCLSTAHLQFQIYRQIHFLVCPSCATQQRDDCRQKESPRNRVTISRAYWLREPDLN